MASWQYKMKVPTEQGYHVGSPNHRPTMGNATGYLKDQDDQIFRLWIHDIKGSFEVSGQTAQSARSRTWFPRNMTQPRLIIAGQTANQSEYGRLAEYIRVSQDKSLRSKKVAHDLNTVTLIIDGQKGVATRSGVRYSRLPIHVKGHIKSIDRVAERFNNAPEFQFEFIVAFSYVGLYTIGQSEINTLAKWMDIVKHEGTFAVDTDYEYAPTVSGPEGSPH